MTTTAPGEAAEAVAQRLKMKSRLPAPTMRRALRITAGLSAAELADALGVSRQAVSKWELGTRTPRGDQLAAYVAVLDELAREPAAS